MIYTISYLVLFIITFIVIARLLFTKGDFSKEYDKLGGFTIALSAGLFWPITLVVMLFVGIFQLSIRERNCNHPVRIPARGAFKSVCLKCGRGNRKPPNKKIAPLKELEKPLKDEDYFTPYNPNFKSSIKEKVKR